MVSRFAAGLVAVAMLTFAGSSLAAKPKPIPPAAAFTLPSARACVTGHKLTLVVRKVPRVKWVSATVRVNGRVVKTVKQLGKPIRLTGLPDGTFAVALVAKAKNGRSAKVQRSYTACALTPQPAPAPGPLLTPTPMPNPTPTSTPAPSPTPTPTPTATATPSPSPVPSIQPGSYAGGGLSFFVSNDIAHLQDITMSVTLTCTPSIGNRTDQFVISEGTLASNGTFDITATGTGLWPQYAPATYSYRFRGTITGTTATGFLTETIVYDDGVVHTCTTGERAFTASRTAQGPQTSAYPRPGSYTMTSGGLTRSFFVSRDGKQLQDVVAAVDMRCTTQGGSSDEMVFAEIPIQPDGSFSSSRTVPGRLSSHVASMTYSFSGHVHSVDAGGNDRLAGVLREIVNYTDGTTFTCDSNQRYWSATRDAQQPQTTAPPPPGSYFDDDDDIALYVSNDGTQLQDVSAELTVSCSPSDSATGDLALSELPIAEDGSFGTVQVEHRQWRGKDATFTYTFRGHLHSVNAAGVYRLAGYRRVDMTFDDGSPTTCTTNDRYWLATRESQPTQTNAPPPAGRYSESSDLSLFVSADQAELQDIEFDAGMRCAPAAPGDDFANNTMPIAEVPIATDGSFSTTITRPGVFGSEPATFTYRLRGHVHSVAPNGRARLAGQIREDVVAASGKKCSTGTLPWTATRDTQGTQTGTPASGAYGSSGLSYTVSGGGIQNFATSVTVRCTPGSSFSDGFTVAALAIQPDGSFSVSGTRTRTVAGYPATITYSLSGNVHGVDSNGRWRMAGVLREDATYSDGAIAYTCSTNDVYWSAVSG